MSEDSASARIVGGRITDSFLIVLLSDQAIGSLKKWLDEPIVRDPQMD